jgi:hypothetical protein
MATEGNYVSDREHYDIHLDVKFDFLEQIDVPALVAACTEKWFSQTLAGSTIPSSDSA